MKVFQGKSPSEALSVDSRLVLQSALALRSSMNSEYSTLTVREIAGSLIPHLAQRNGIAKERGLGKIRAKTELPKYDVLEEFLLWPPDLFAFTSRILSITGAYHLVVSPPRYKDHTTETMEWPPDQNWLKETKGFLDADRKDGEVDWIEEVRQVGLAWRDKLIALKRNNLEKDLAKCKNGNEEDRIKMIQKRAGPLVGEKWEREDPESWIPIEVWAYWRKFREGLGSNWEGNVTDLLCDKKHKKQENGKDQKDQTDKEKSDNWETFQALMTLHAIADEACSGWGIRSEDLREGPNGQVITRAGEKSDAQEYAEHLLETLGTLATIDNQRCRVLPKRHTPGVGITLRSLSANLAHHRSSVDVSWRVSPLQGQFANPLIARMSEKDNKDKKEKDGKMLSVLLLPWPLKVHSLDFKLVHPDHVTMNKDKFGFFSYSPEKPSSKRDEKFQALLAHALETARLETAAIDVVVLPEGALTKTEVKLLERTLERFDVSFYVAGVRCNPKDEDDPGEKKRYLHDNMVYFKMGNYRKSEPFGSPGSKGKEDGVQHKHHRWKINRSQVTTYSLGHILSPTKEWWEAIKIRRRKVSFINIGEELTICPLICEDLARQDPIADLIRAAGPSLVITILMDGPQKMDRWSAKYASVLAEDPGSAVITLTSFGMVKRWRPRNRQSSRVVALWSDGRGEVREIELKKNSIGILLNLCLDPQNEMIADGRIEGNETNAVILGGIHQICREKQK